jgi:solute carrier family 35 protein F1/2
LLSAELLDNWAIAVVVVLSFLFLKVRYRWNQILGIAVCIAGMVLVVIGDLLTDKNYVAVDMVKGDLFVILGATCYGISNTLEEFLVSKRPIYEVLGQMGFFGMLINGVQAAIFERESIKEAHWGSRIAGWFTGYTAAMLVLYCTAPILFRMSSAAFYNLSLLTSDFWGLLIGIKVFGYYVFWLYPVGFVFTVGGMIIYNSIVGSWNGEAEKPWLGVGQRDGIAGIGTAKTKAPNSSETYLESDV